MDISSNYSGGDGGGGTVEGTTLTFADDLSDDIYKLFTFPDEIMRAIEQHSVCHGESAPLRLVMKADADAESGGQSLVLCTDERTYTVTKIETSNTIMLLHDEHDALKRGDGQDVIVRGMVHCHYDVVPTVPRLLKLRELLKSSFYSGDEDDEIEEEDSKIPVEEGHDIKMMLPPQSNMGLSKERSKRLYTLEMLEQSLQASRKEILHALQEMNAINVRGYWRIVEPSVFADVLDVILATVASERFQSIESGGSDADIVADIPWRKCAEGLNYSARIVRHCLHTFSVDMDCDQYYDYSGSGEQAADTYKLSFKKIALYRARQLLLERAQQKRKSEYTVSEFLDRWKQSLSQVLPDSDDPSHPWNKTVSNMDFLKGQAVCVVDRVAVASEECVRYFDKNLLPAEAKERFTAMFQFKSRWSLEEMEPYISDILVKEKTNLDKLLATYTRSTQTLTGGEKLYTLK